MVGYTNQENMVDKGGIYILVFGKINKLVIQNKQLIGNRVCWIKLHGLQRKDLGITKIYIYIYIYIYAHTK
jgi:hypothetical protein